MKNIEITSLLAKTAKNQGICGLLHLPIEWLVLKLKPSYVPIFPSFLQIEPTIRCNLRCRMCDLSIWGRTCADMSFENFKKILNQFSVVRNLNIQGMGEPLLNKDLFKMIAYAKSKHIPNVSIITNGMLLNEANSRALLNSGIDRITISLDAATPVLYESIRRGAKFSVVTKNIKHFSAINRKNGSKIAVNIGMTCNADNIHEVQKMVKLVSAMGVSNLNIGGTHMWGKDHWKSAMKGKLLENNAQKTKDYIRQAENEALKRHINLTFTFLSFKKKSIKCTWPWLGSYITADGYVTPCCIHGFDPRKLNFGNVFQTPFKKIWNSASYMQFRKKFSSGTPDFCKCCPEI